MSTILSKGFNKTRYTIGSTFVVIAPDAPVVSELLKYILKKEGCCTEYINSKKKTDEERIAEHLEKTGVSTGLGCKNSITESAANIPSGLCSINSWDWNGS